MSWRHSESKGSSIIIVVGVSPKTKRFSLVLMHTFESRTDSTSVGGQLPSPLPSLSSSLSPTVVVGVVVGTPPHDQTHPIRCATIECWRFRVAEFLVLEYRVCLVTSMYKLYPVVPTDEESQWIPGSNYSEGRTVNEGVNGSGLFLWHTSSVCPNISKVSLYYMSWRRE